MHLQDCIERAITHLENYVLLYMERLRLMKKCPGLGQAKVQNIPICRISKLIKFACKLIRENDVH